MKNKYNFSFCLQSGPINYLIIFLFISNTSYIINGQNSIPDVLQKYNSESVSYITVKEAFKSSSALFLDAREVIEFNISHIPGAMNIGYNEFNSKSLLKKVKDKDTYIIVYCSIGVRSEKIGEKLLKLGYTNVFNLYGGIFEWKNAGYKVVDNLGRETEIVHPFSKEWAKYLKKNI